MSIRSRVKSAITAFWFDSKADLTKLGGNYFLPISASMTLYNDLRLLKDYTELPEVNAVINRKARMWSKMTLRIVSRETGKDIKNYEYLVKVLRNPNWYQAQREFLMQTKLFREIFGNEYLYFNKSIGLPFRSVKSLYTLPPYLVKSETPQDKPFFMYDSPVIKYNFQWGNTSYPLDPGSIIQFNDNRVEMDKDNWVTGTSKLEALKVPLNNIRAAYEARNVLIVNRGALGIFTSGVTDVNAGILPLDAKEVERVQKEFSHYGMGANQWQYIFTHLALKWQQVSVDDPSKLGLFQEIESDFQKIIDAYGLDRDMFGNEKGATWENKKQGERAAWNNTVIPEALEWVEGLNDAFNNHQEAWRLVADFVDIQVLQQNMEEKGRGIKAVTDALSIMLADGVITPEDYQKEINKLGFELTSLPKQSEP